MFADYLKNSISVILGSFASKLITLASGFVLAYLLGKIGFGRIGVIQGTVAVFMSLAVLGHGRKFGEVFANQSL